ncbi:MAG: polyphosphate kinase 1 [Bacteroidota bacterium]
MIKEFQSYLYKDRELSWMLFNERVLQEAENTETPLLERLKFLAIFSSNNDEFFRVRVAALRRGQKGTRKALPDTQFPPETTLGEIQRVAVIQQDRFNKVYNTIIEELAKQKIFIINEQELDDNQKITVKDYFKREVLPHLFPVLIDDLKHIPHLKDRSIYLAVRLSDTTEALKPKHALIEIPGDALKRFYILPRTDENTFIMFLDDVIRISLKHIFSIFDYNTYEAYTVKLTRDADFVLENEENDVFKETLLDKIQKSIKQRSKGVPTRFIYDNSLPKSMLDLLSLKLQLKNVNLIPGGRYHNFKDFMDFPKVGTVDDYYPPMPPLPVAELDKARTMFDVIQHKDFMLHHPYQSFDYLIRMLREAAIDPKVTTIKITLYRVAKHSNVVNALINAVKNGKKVIVLMELQARFDEEHNIFWTNQLQEAGARVHFGKPGQKVHCKVCLIYREEEGKTTKYAHLSTGNYNGVTAKLYCDHGLFTKDKRLTEDMEKLMDVLFQGPRKHKFDHLLVAPDYLAKQFMELIDKEVANAKSGKPAYIIAKMNSLMDDGVVRKLYEANRAGVNIKLIIRGICTLVPGVKGLSENIEVVSIIDRLLEHARVFIFANGGDEKMYLSSADWMTRNLYRRIECAFPVFDENCRQQIKDIIEIQLKDNTKARVIDHDFDNKYVHRISGSKAIRAQYETYEYLKRL